MTSVTMSSSAGVKMVTSEPWETLMRQYQQWVYNIAYGMLASPEDASDVAQDVFSLALGKYWAVSIQISVFDVALPDCY